MTKKNVITNKFEATMIACQKSKNLIESKRKTNKRMNESVKRRSKKFESDELDPEDDIPDDVSDDILVVTDPELNPEDMDDKISELQDIVDETPEDETPTIDDYVDDLVYTCPVCGSNFFSDSELNDGDECPVCGEIPDKFILVGDVASTDEVAENDEDNEDDEDLDLDTDLDESSNRKSRRTRKTERNLYLDERTFNPILTKFVRENYKNARSMKLVGAKLSNRTLSLECVIKYKSGNDKKTNIKIENFQIKPTMNFRGKLDSAFKVESAKNSHMSMSAICVKGIKNEDVIRATGLRYNFVSVHENKRYKVYGSCKLNG